MGNKGDARHRDRRTDDPWVSNGTMVDLGMKPRLVEMIIEALENNHTRKKQGQMRYKKPPEYRLKKDEVVRHAMKEKISITKLANKFEINASYLSDLLNKKRLNVGKKTVTGIKNYCQEVGLDWQEFLEEVA